MSDEPNRLSRWSQRKLAARRGEAVPDEVPPVATDSSPDQDVAAVPEKATDEAVPELPPIDELNADSDYTVFLARNVPEVMQRAALRKLWANNPALGVLDGLNDYDDDYNAVQTVLTLAQTGYRVGKGYVDENENDIDTPEQAPAEDERASAESPAEAAPPAGEQGDGGAPSNNDAPVEEPADAVRQVVARNPVAEVDESAEASDK